MEFLIVGMLLDSFHYAINIEAKKKGKICFVNKTTSQTSKKKLLIDFDKSKNPSQPTPPSPNHQNIETFRKTRRIATNKLLPKNGVIITIQHGMIHQNEKLGRQFGENVDI